MTAVELRQYRRVRLRLPARVRWSAPFGPASEITETINVSKGGVLLRSHEEHATGARVWVAFPYEGREDENQPEIAARIVRIANGSGPQTIALELLLAGPHANTNGSSAHKERREANRNQISVPASVRPAYSPWAEEVMTVDVSAGGLRFVTRREYTRGEQLFVKFGGVAPAAWTSDCEESVRVVRTTSVESGATLEIAVRRERSAQ